MSLCMGCMQELNGSVICPNCHFDNSEVQSAPFLPFGTELAGRYVTGTLFLLKNILSVATVILTGILQDRSLCP